MGHASRSFFPEQMLPCCQAPPNRGTIATSGSLDQ